MAENANDAGNTAPMSGTIRRIRHCVTRAARPLPNMPPEKRDCGGDCAGATAIRTYDYYRIHGHRVGPVHKMAGGRGNAPA